MEYKVEYTFNGFPNCNHETTSGTENLREMEIRDSVVWHLKSQNNFKVGDNLKIISITKLLK